MNHNHGASRIASTANRSLTANQVLRNTYLLLAMTLIPTIVGSFIGTSLSWRFMANSPMLSFIGIMAGMYGFSFLIHKNRNSGLGVSLLLAFTFFMGLLLGPTLQVALSLKNGGSLIAYAAGTTAVIFFSLSSWIQATGKDLSGLSRFLFVGFIVLMTAIIANMFLKIPALSLAVTALIALFSALGLAYNISRAVNGGEDNYVLLTMSLYIDLLNLFVSLLRLLMALGGQQRD